MFKKGIKREAKEIEGNRSSNIDIIKAVCIFFVLITHYRWQENERLRMLFPFWIDMAVPIFMIISGYVYAVSYERNRCVCIREGYRLRVLSKKFIRYTIPYTLVFLTEILAMYIVKPEYFLGGGEERTWKLFMTGGIGHGSYYYPVMVQFLFLFPLIYFIIKEENTKGFICLLFANAMYEIVQTAYGLSKSCYRLLIFRYIMLISFGVYIYQNRDRKVIRKWGWFSFVLGFAYIFVNSYLGFSFSTIPYWQGTCWLAGLYILPIAAFWLRVNVKCKFLEIIGRASYHIFLCQMVVYGLGTSIIYNMAFSRAMEFLICFGSSLIGGVAFYYIETPFTKRIIKYSENVIEKINLEDWNMILDRWFLK